MGLFSNKKKLCPVCGEPTPRFLPTKVEGKPICKACDKKIYLPDGKLEQMTLDEFLQYMNFYEENGSLRDSFTETYSFNVAMSGTVIGLDMSNGLFRFKNLPSALVFEASHMKSFRIWEDENLLFESQEKALRCYESDVPTKVRQLAGVIGEFNARRKEYEFRKEMEIRREEAAKRRGEEYQRRYIPEPTFGGNEPFENFHVEIVLEHPYWNEFREEIYGPRFDRYYPSVDSYICDYQNEAERMHELAMNLMQFMCPEAQEIRDADLTAPETRQASTATGMSAIEEIKQYKELLDAGIITEEEFTMKKRQLLGL